MNECLSMNECVCVSVSVIEHICQYVALSMCECVRASVCVS